MRCIARTPSSIRSNLLRSFIGITALIFATASQARTKEETCQVWSNMAQTFAEGRDAGVSLKAQNKKINTLVGKRGVTPANIRYIRTLASLAYEDFKNKTPEQIGQIEYVGCLVE